MKFESFVKLGIEPTSSKWGIGLRSIHDSKSRCKDLAVDDCKVRCFTQKHERSEKCAFESHIATNNPVAKGKNCV